ncbi:sigma-70 family RNA polymerase sigma factor [Streptomyces sp. NPDC006872]|uniref:RNA polymerase sigma factor n=1 Tax=Streptomyces sp. NPDC006872 TaxID=3155720 RepID=UPI00340FD86A
MSHQDPTDGAERPVVRPAARSGSFGERLGERCGDRSEVDEEFSAFYRSAIRQLVAFLIHQGAELHVAADIAQDTMIKAYRSWTELHRPRPWVHKVASRALVRMVAAVREDLVERVPEPTSLLACPDAITEWEGRYDMLPVLRSLPARQRQVLAWTLAGYKPGDIADELGLPSDTVRANLIKARRAAAAYLKNAEAQQ